MMTLFKCLNKYISMYTGKKTVKCIILQLVFLIPEISNFMTHNQKLYILYKFAHETLRVFLKVVAFLKLLMASKLMTSLCRSLHCTVLRNGCKQSNLGRIQAKKDLNWMSRSCLILI